jgi:hypothetical protein
MPSTEDLNWLECGPDVENRLVKLSDDHPGRHNDGVEVRLCMAYCNRFSRWKPFLTGIRPNGAQLPNRGMFSTHEEPVQVICKGDDPRATFQNEHPEDAWVLTMSNCTVISREQIDQLTRDGRICIHRGHGYVINIALLDFVE